MGKSLLSFPERLDRLWGTPNLQIRGYRGIFPSTPAGGEWSPSNHRRFFPRRRVPRSKYQFNMRLGVPQSPCWRSAEWIFPVGNQNTTTCPAIGVYRTRCYQLCAVCNLYLCRCSAWCTPNMLSVAVCSVYLNVCRCKAVAMLSFLRKKTNNGHYVSPWVHFSFWNSERFSEWSHRRSF
jgi:hypothetical protein